MRMYAENETLLDDGSQIPCIRIISTTNDFVQFSPNSFMSFFFSLTNNGKELLPIRKHAMHCRLHVKCPTALPVKQKHTNLKNWRYIVPYVSSDS